MCSSTAVQCDDGVRRGTKAHIGGGGGGWQLTGLGGPRMASRSRSRKCSRAAISPRYPVCPQRACKLPSGVRPSSSSAAGTGDPLRMAANGVVLCRPPDRSRPRVLCPRGCFLALTGELFDGRPALIRNSRGDPPAAKFDVDAFARRLPPAPCNPYSARRHEGVPVSLKTGSI